MRMRVRVRESERLFECQHQPICIEKIIIKNVHDDDVSVRVCVCV